MLKETLNQFFRTTILRNIFSSVSLFSQCYDFSKQDQN